MFYKIIQNFKLFFIIWGILILVNQIFIFGACFSSYCLIAALPHTGIITVLIIRFKIKEELKKEEFERKKSIKEEQIKRALKALNEP